MKRDSLTLRIVGTQPGPLGEWIVLLGGSHGDERTVLVVRGYRGFVMHVGLGILRFNTVSLL